jgi:hypothetical protein
MLRLNLNYIEQFHFIPRIIKTGAGYNGKDKGIALSWIGFMGQIRKPINERKNGN